MYALSKRVISQYIRTGCRRRLRLDLYGSDASRRTTGVPLKDAARPGLRLLTEQGRRTAGQVGEVARDVTERSADAARQGLQVIQRAAGAAGEIQREVAHCSAEKTAALGSFLST